VFGMGTSVTSQVKSPEMRRGANLAVRNADSRTAFTGRSKMTRYKNGRARVYLVTHKTLKT
jgi:hypothetical protein